ncbi:MAG: zinc-binding dehydrogenase [Acidimicrobiia bacterium]|nr:zinc-binding dehydrogenase [Acidimicrobiia bacterium]
MPTARPVASRGAVMTSLGGPEVLEVQPWEVSAPGADEVRVSVDAAAISFADLLVMQGVHPERRKPPFVPGWDVVGEVEAVGSAVKRFSIGDRVAGLSIVGGWAEHATVPVSRVVPVPASVESTAAVCLVMDYVVAYQMLTRTAEVQAGDTVLVQGAGGGVGTALMEVARTMDVRVLGSDRGKKRAHLEALGGTLIDFETEDVVARCLEITGGRGVEAAFDGIGSTAQASLQAVRRGGTLVWYGMVTMLSGGQRDVGKMARTVGLTVAAFSRNVIPGGKQVKLYSIQMLARKHPEWFQSDLTTLLAMLERGEIEPVVAARWTLDEVPEAAAGMARGALPGKQVISMAR